MKRYCFIFARGGSKGLPKKNIKLLNNKPLIHYSIECAKSIPDIQKIFVSTDCKEIAETADVEGVEVIDRPQHLAIDSAPEWLAWQHAIHWVELKYGWFDEFISLPTTSPLRSVDDVCSAIAQLNSSDFDICVSMAQANRNPYFNMVTQSIDGRIELICKTGDLINRRQDAPRSFDLTTVVYCAKTEFIKNSQSLFSGRVTAIEVPKLRAIDIDDEVDFKFAEFLIKTSTNAKK